MFPQFPQTSHFPAYFHSSTRKEGEASRRRPPQDGGTAGARVAEEEGGLRSRRRAGSRGEGGACVCPGELIGTALLFYPPTKACSFGKAHCPTARQPLQSRFTAAAERSQHPAFFGLALLSQSDSHTGISPDCVQARFVKFKTTSQSKFGFHAFSYSRFAFQCLFFRHFSGMPSSSLCILGWRMS